MIGRGWVLLAGALALAGAARAETASFGDWTVVCDNVRNCTAYGFSSEAAEDIAYLRVARLAAAGASPDVKLTFYEPPPGLWRVDVDGKALGTVTPEQDGQDDVFPSAKASAGLLAAVPNGSALNIHAGGKSVAVSLAGSSAALRWMDTQQKRAGTAEALVAKGAAAGPPAPPAPPLVRAAPTVAQTGLPTTPPKAVLAQMADCDDDIGELGFDPTVARLSKGVVFWALACSRGAYNVMYALYLTDEAGGSVRPVSILYPGEEPVMELMNVDFDPKTQTLANFDKARGLGDCGAFNEWVWDGKGFVMTSQVLMPECRGVNAADWPTSYVTRSR